jgi:hypothetical protein
VSRTLTAPPTDKRMWKSLLRLVHPDTYGDHDLFIWTSAVYEHVAGDAPEEAARREPPKHHARTTSSDRVSFDGVFDRFASHEELTRHAIRTAEQVEEPYASLLRLLADCYELQETLDRARWTGDKALAKAVLYRGYELQNHGIVQSYFQANPDDLPIWDGFMDSAEELNVLEERGIDIPPPDKPREVSGPSSPLPNGSSGAPEGVPVA